LTVNLTVYLLQILTKGVSVSDFQSKLDPTHYSRYFSFRDLVFCILIPLSVGLSHCSPSTSKSHVKESWDDMNHPSIIGAKTLTYETLARDDYSNGKLASQPWSDSYWPLNQGGISSRWIDLIKNPSLPILSTTLDPSSSDFNQTSKELISKSMELLKDELNQPFEKTIGVSIAEKIDLSLGRTKFALTLSEYTSFVENTKRYEDRSWGWMGSCHGWAPVSSLYSAPVSSVLAIGSSGQEVLFTPGDVRGLLTKAAADQGFNGREAYVGSRCNESRSNIPKDASGRIIDGSLGVEPNSNGTMKASVAVQIIANNWGGHQELGERYPSIAFKILPLTLNSPTLWADAVSISNEEHEVFGVRIYSTKQVNDRLLRDMVIQSSNDNEVGIHLDENGNAVYRNGELWREESTAKELWQLAIAGAPSELRAPMAALNFKSWKECRDLNAGTFHLTLANLLSEGGSAPNPPRSFVMDITRDEQVWNQPIYSFKSRFGTPTPVSLDGHIDPNLKYRAAGTEQIVDVYTEIEYGSENGPMIVYEPSHESLSRKRYRYTLELDKNGFVIGGEWHPLSSSGTGEPLSGVALMEDLVRLHANRHDKTADAPDFIWGHAPGSKIRNGRFIPSSFLEKIYACSTKGTPNTTIDYQGKNLSVVHCPL
jgi:hypothetical protein